MPYGLSGEPKASGETFFLLYIFFVVVAFILDYHI